MKCAFFSMRRPRPGANGFRRRRRRVPPPGGSAAICAAPASARGLGAPPPAAAVECATAVVPPSPPPRAAPQALRGPAPGRRRLATSCRARAVPSAARSSTPCCSPRPPAGAGFMVPGRPGGTRSWIGVGRRRAGLPAVLGARARPDAGRVVHYRTGVSTSPRLRAPLSWPWSSRRPERRTSTTGRRTRWSSCGDAAASASGSSAGRSTTGRHRQHGAPQSASGVVGFAALTAAITRYVTGRKTTSTPTL